MHHSTDKIAHTTAFGTPVVEHWPGMRNISSGTVEKNLVTHKQPNYTRNRTFIPLGSVVLSINHKTK